MIVPGSRNISGVRSHSQIFSGRTAMLTVVAVARASAAPSPGRDARREACRCRAYGAGHQVDGADEAGDERRGRALVDVLGRAALLDRPSFMTAIRSLMLIASSWSWVTKTKVMPTSRWIALSSTCICRAELQVERAERLVEQQHRGPVDQRPGERDALPLAAGQLGAACASSRP